MAGNHHFGRSEQESEQYQRRVLLQVFLLNVLLSSSLATAGVFADSSGLIANALDNASDSAVYAVSYFAVGGSFRRKAIASSRRSLHSPSLSSCAESGRRTSKNRA